MKNLFDYATKELSQDAFLRWLFENYACKDNLSLKVASQYIIKKMCGLSDEEIIEVKTYSQWHKIDIFVLVKTDKRNIALFIEDKVFSSEHNQLLRYNEIIEKSYKNKKWELNKLGCTEDDIIKVFYKPLWLSEDETDAVKKAGWDIYNIECIKYLFEKFSNTDCSVLKQYIEHISDIEKALETRIMPKSSEKGLDLIKWKSYFEYEILPRIKTGSKELKYSVCIGIYNYAYLCIMKNVEGESAVPYIELRSRDIDEDGLSVALLCYGADYEKNGEKIKNTAARLENAPNKLFMQKNKRKNEPKQLGRTAKTNEDVVPFLKKCIEDYEYIMKEW